MSQSGGIDRVQYQLDPIAYRSVGELKLAEKILSREGQWDAERQCFLTREKLLQDLTKEFTSLNMLLRNAPSRTYAVEGRDLNATYPKAPRLLMKEHNVSNSQLSTEDPTKQNIEYRRQIAAKNALLRERDMEAGGGGGGGAFGGVGGGKEQMEWIESLEHEFLRAASSSTSAGVLVGTNRKSSSSPFPQRATNDSSALRRNSSAVATAPSASPQGDSGPSLSVPRAGGDGPVQDSKVHSSAIATSSSDWNLPRITPDAVGAIGHNTSNSSALNASCRGAAAGTSTTTSRHSSLLMQLKATKAAYMTHQANSTIVSSILSMDTSAAMKSAVTRMFANPKNADAISKEEHDRREREFAEERTRTMAYQENLVREEREAIERELAQLK